MFQNEMPFQPTHGANISVIDELAAADKIWQQLLFQATNLTFPD